MAASTGIIVADFETSLAAAVAAGATSATLQSATDDDSVALPTGTYFFTIDGGNSSKEHIVCTLTSTALTAISSISRQGTVTSGFARAHRVGASVVITDFAHIKRINNLLDGTTNFNSSVPLGYDGTASITTANQFATKAYVDATAVAGAPNASTTVKGIVEEATLAETLARTTSGGTGAQLYVNPGTLISTLNYDYVADAGSNDTYVITATPAPTAYATGQLFTFKANTVNTGACTLNVNSLGAKSLKVNKDLDPQDGYIKAGQIVTVVYDGTNMQILSVSGKPSVSQSGEEVYAASSGGSDTYAITVAPAPAAYATGQVFRFKADVANTGAATLNVNSLGAKTIKKAVSVDLSTGDILASQLVQVIYDGTNFQLQSAVQPLPLMNAGQASRATGAGTGTQNIAHGLGVVPRLFRVWYSANNGNNNSFITGSGSALSSSSYSCTYNSASNDTNSDGNQTTQTTSAIIETKNDAGTTLCLATVSAMDATNVTLNFTTFTLGVYFQWEAFA